jgi:hypothetical protein
VDHNDSRQAFDAWWTEIAGTDYYTSEYETALMAWMAGASWHSQAIRREQDEYLRALEQRPSVVVAPEDL